MKKVILTNNVLHAAGYGPSEHHAKNKVVELEDKVADSLIERGFAKPLAEGKPVTPPPPPKK